MALVFNVFLFEIRRQLLKLILFEVSRRFVGGASPKDETDLIRIIKEGGNLIINQDCDGYL